MHSLSLQSLKGSSSASSLQATHQDKKLSSMRKSVSAPSLRDIKCKCQKDNSPSSSASQPMNEPSLDPKMNRINEGPPGLVSLMSKLTRPIAEQVVSGEAIGETTATNVDIHLPNIPKINLQTTQGDRVSSQAASIMPLNLPILDAGIAAQVNQVQSESGNLVTSVDIGALMSIHLLGKSETLNWTFGLCLDNTSLKPFLKAEINTSHQVVSLRINMDLKFQVQNAVASYGNKHPTNMKGSNHLVSGESSQNINLEVNPQDLQLEIQNILRKDMKGVLEILKLSQEMDESQEDL